MKRAFHSLPNQSRDGCGLGNLTKFGKQALRMHRQRGIATHHKPTVSDRWRPHRLMAKGFAARSPYKIFCFRSIHLNENGGRSIHIHTHKKSPFVRLQLTQVFSFLCKIRLSCTSFLKSSTCSARGFTQRPTGGPTAAAETAADFPRRPQKFFQRICTTTAAADKKGRERKESSDWG